MLPQKLFAKMPGICLVLISAIILCFPGCGSDGDGSGTRNTQLSNEEFSAGLKGLGIDYESILNNPLKDVNGNDLPDNYNPLSSQTYALIRIPEIYMAGNSIQGTSMPNAGVINPDNYSVLASDTSALAASGHDTTTKCASGDTDGDGLEEVITAVFDTTANSLTLRETKKDKTSVIYTFTNILSTSDASISSANIDIYRTCIDLGDLDGDGKSEILVAYNNTLIIFDDKAAGYAKLINNKIFSSLQSGYAQYLRVRCGNFDFDSAREIVVTNGSGWEEAEAQYFIYDDLAQNPTMSAPMNATGSSGSLNYIRAANMAIGDFNGDRLQDIVFCGLTNNNVTTNTNLSYVISLTLDANSKPVLNPVIGYSGYSSTNIMEPMASGKFSKDIDYDGYIIKTTCYFPKFSTPRGPVILEGALFDGIKMGDIDGDGRDEIIAYGSATYSGFLSLYVGAVENYTGLPISYTEKWLLNTSGGAICLPCTMSSVRLKKSTVTEFVGHETLFTEPKILEVIASPPYWEGINQAEGSTSFGESKSSESDTEHKVGFSAYGSIGFEAELPLVAKTKFTTKLTAGFDYTASKTTERTESYAYTTPAGEDMVVFTCIPYDVYYYKVLSTNDPDVKIGSVTSVNSPRDTITIPTTVEFFNKNNGSFRDIGTDILCHTKGKPNTYATYAAISGKIDTAGKGYYTLDSDGKTVGEGSGTVSLSMEDTLTNGQNYDVSVGVSEEMEFGALGVTWGFGLELHYGYSYSVSFSESTTIEGIVGCISAEDYNLNRGFTWGLTSWFYENEDATQSFPVVTYWVK